MMHDFAKKKKPAKKYAAGYHAHTSPSGHRAHARSGQKKPLRVSVVAALFTTVTVVAVGFSHVVSAVSEDINETMAEASARKDAERALKAHLQAEKLRLADERRLQKQIAEDKANAERSAGYDFYEDLVGRPWPVPVESEAYRNKPMYTSAAAKEDTEKLAYSLQAALYRDEKEALSAQKSLSRLGYAGKVDTVKVKAGGMLYRVTLGPYTGLEKATHVRDQLQTFNYYAQVYREDEE